MGMKRNSSSTATFVDGKIYVAGGCDDKYVDYPNWMEVFDLETQTWSPVKNPRVFWLHEEDRIKGFIAKSVWLEGKLYVFGDESVVYNQEEGRWDPIGMDNYRMAWAARHCHCVIDDVLYFWDGERFRWWDSKASLWKELSGIEGLPDLSGEVRKYCKMVDLGGKIGFLWCEYLYNQPMEICRIWCAEISLERRNGDEICGKVEWFDYVLRAHGSCSSFNVVSASV
ncbi:unnamed protein product [Microthlaspi erraticum]|uniref:FKB95-like N-terminal Kelch domain-containing protein n=1 Tax=Microthlaspi erraticum TaxID=1685480 RepID=A0A6D2HQP1_9BRAS|nr:unnamed protein product [Microthlaspi erraticum]